MLVDIYLGQSKPGDVESVGNESLEILDVVDVWRPVEEDAQGDGSTFLLETLEKDRQFDSIADLNCDLHF